MTTILFLGLHHSPNDSRLCHRQMRAIRAADAGATFFFLQGRVCREEEGVRVRTEEHYGFTVRVIEVRVRTPTRSPLRPFRWPTVRRELRRGALLGLEGNRPSVIQASDCKEIRLALELGEDLGAPVVYDSHEDYPRQAWDYRRSTLWGLVAAVDAAASELRYVRRAKAVFATDEFLVRRYRKVLYGAKRVGLLRNYPYSVLSREPQIHEGRQALRLVYVGGVNEHRGVRECAMYVNRFNKETASRRLSFSVFSPRHPLVDDLVGRGLVQHHEWQDYETLMPALRDFDVGVCLLLPIKKFHRNLPVKNFDYMAAGLPILTSAFGAMKDYLDRSGAGLSINPRSYEEFAAAATKLLDPEVRRRMATKGSDWIRKEATFGREASDYIREMVGSEMPGAGL